MHQKPFVENDKIVWSNFEVWSAILSISSEFLAPKIITNHLICKYAYVDCIHFLRHTVYILYKKLHKVYYFFKSNIT